MPAAPAVGRIAVGSAVGDLAQPAGEAPVVGGPATKAPRGGAVPAAGPGGACAGSVDMTGTSTSANDTWVTPALRRRSGGNSSSTAWKFVPPKPKALTPARRMPPGGRSHGGVRC